LIDWLSDWLVDWLTWCLMPALTVCQLYRSATTATFLTDNTMAKRNKNTKRQTDKQWFSKHHRTK
jgi:hypothetical protein